jgi:hypothetical protein
MTRQCSLIKEALVEERQARHQDNPPELKPVLFDHVSQR